ncbi:uncharacterized protein N0V96_007685 [Colletotrichum fioriniae]|uniref:uncharacterized protein n=1 Tax=Colletotrichum fioriniae TaxID=710243 RepID=UPI0032DBB6D4|nr:hypothetical protein N0V96_007685 [Colletotrichum fioriniae]
MFDIKPNPDLIEKLGGPVIFHQVDVAEYESQARCFQETWNKYGRLDLVCTNAGIFDQSGSKAAVWQFVRASAQILQMSYQKENIRINCIRPGSIATPLMPAAMAAAAGSGITPMSTVVNALDRIITDESLSGAALECSVDKVLLTPDPKPLNGETSTGACFVWDPIFHQIHHEPSGLPDAADPVQTKGSSTAEKGPGMFAKL